MTHRNMVLNRHVYINNKFKQVETTDNRSKVLVNPKFLATTSEIASGNIHVNPAFVASSSKGKALNLKNLYDPVIDTNSYRTNTTTQSYNLTASSTALGSKVGSTGTSSYYKSVNHTNIKGSNLRNQSRIDTVSFPSNFRSFKKESNETKGNKFKFVKKDSNHEKHVQNCAGGTSKNISVEVPVSSFSKYNYKRNQSEGTNLVKALEFRSLSDEKKAHLSSTNSKYKFRKSGTDAARKVQSSSIMESEIRKANQETGTTPCKNLTIKSSKYKRRPSVSHDPKHSVSRNKVYVRRKVTSATRNIPAKTRTTNKNASGNRTTVRHKLINANATPARSRLVGTSKTAKYKSVAPNSCSKYRLGSAGRHPTKYRLVNSKNSGKYRSVSSRSPGKYRLVSSSNPGKYRLVSSSNPGKYRLVSSKNPGKYSLVNASNPSARYRLISVNKTPAKHRFKNKALIVRKFARYSPRVGINRNSGSSNRVSSVGGIRRTWNRYATQGGKNIYRTSHNNSKSEGACKKSWHKPGRFHYTSKNVSNVSNRSIATSRSRVAASHVLQKTKWFLMMKRKRSSQLCLFYTKFGRCSRKDKRECPYRHDPDKVAVCRRFLSGKCQDINCLLSHEVAPEKMPTCTFFLRGVCVKENCPYLHVKVNPNAEVCKDFVDGYCSKGVECRLKHELQPTEKGKHKRKLKREQTETLKDDEEQVIRKKHKPKNEETETLKGDEEQLIRYYNIEEDKNNDTERKREENDQPFTKRRRISGSLPLYIPLN